MKTKKLSLLTVILALMWILALAAATVYDLDISLAIADENSIYGRIFEVAGEPPAILFTSFNLALMTAYFLKKPSCTKKDYMLAALCLIGTVGTAVFTVNKTADYLTDYGIISDSITVTVCALLASAAVTALFFILTMRMDYHTTKRYFNIALHCVIAAILTFVIIWGLKLVWGRVRFRQLENDLSLFTPWYLPQGFTGFFSFPSGHTANATVIISSLYYFHDLQSKHKKYEKPLKVLLAIWIALVAFSRVRIGAHYLSDVLFGLAVTVFIVYFSKPRKK